MRAASALILVVACTAGPPRPLAEAILGEWEVLCRTDEESTATCLGKEKHGLYKQFLAGGRLVGGAREGTTMEGRWTLAGDALTVTFEGGGLHLEETYRARIEDDRLVLWDASRGFGAVHGRRGAPFVSAASVRSGDGQTAHAIGGVGYTIALPSDYVLTRDDNARQQWSPAAGEGFVVELSLSPRPRKQVGGQWVTTACDAGDDGAVLSSGQVIDGVRRTTSSGTSICLASREDSLMCSVEHSRGFLEETELDPATALCRSLAVAR